MTHHNKLSYSVILAMSMALSACSIFEPAAVASSLQAACSDGHPCGGAVVEEPSNEDTLDLSQYRAHSVPTAFSTPVHFQMLDNYVEQMAIDLSRELVDLSMEYPIAVTSFVQLDSTLDNADSLGNQLAESFITELRKVGLLVNDHKVTGNIAVSPTGDFALSRDPMQLKSAQNIGYVLTGTMVKNNKGMMINARIVGVSSNVVVAATSKLIPNIMLTELQ
ncbi:FlgO family outer membrane protein [Flavobacterium sp. W21_SRS_FM6]|uniref:FlgO family outer membrane protein n=1 Tax=Flavobacterium sp. W21_SRS_FM6 TaxID=3240268 RepID=UPI003F92424D